jgi:PhnB protein
MSGHIPDGHHTVTPYLIVAGAAEAIAFYAAAFGAVEIFRLAEPGGKVGYAEIEIGDSRIMLADEYPDLGARSPHALGGSPAMLHLYVPDADAAAERAVAAGATLQKPVADQFHGHRSGTVTDPFGYSWAISTRTEALEPGEIVQRWTRMFEEQATH